MISIISRLMMTDMSKNSKFLILLNDWQTGSQRNKYGRQSVGHYVAG